MIKTTTLAALVILVLVAGCQKDPIETCVNDAMASWYAKYPDEAAINKANACAPNYPDQRTRRLLGMFGGEDCKNYVPTTYQAAELENKAFVRLRCMRSAAGK